MSTRNIFIERYPRDCSINTPLIPDAAGPEAGKEYVCAGRVSSLFCK